MLHTVKDILPKVHKPVRPAQGGPKDRLGGRNTTEGASAAADCCSDSHEALCTNV